jgi:hypothetical protein
MAKSSRTKSSTTRKTVSVVRLSFVRLSYHFSGFQVFRKSHNQTVECSERKYFHSHSAARVCACPGSGSNSIDKLGETTEALQKISEPVFFPQSFGQCIHDLLYKSAIQEEDSVVWAPIPMGYREQIVPYPSNPNQGSTGRIMIPFYPLGNSKANGQGLPILYCLTQRGLKNPQDSVFNVEIAAGKKSVFFQLTVRCLYILWDLRDLTSSCP